MNHSSEVQPGAYHVVMFSLHGTDAAARIVNRLKLDRVLEGCEIEAEALVSRDDAGGIHYHEKGSAGIGAAAGAVTAGVLGLVGGPVILPIMLVLGAVVGGIAGHFAGQVLPPEDLRKVGGSLPPGSSAYLVVVDAAHANSVADAFSTEGGQVLNLPIRTELSCAIREAVVHSVARM